MIAPADAVPKTVPLPSDYRFERVLGQGGMGLVVAATRAASGERVAIKVIRPDRARDRTNVERFLREGRIAGRLRSEHVARVLDVGAVGSDDPYLVMEYLEGESLEAALRRRGALPVAEAVDCILQACEAVAEAHALGVVHRDLKPGNIFLTRLPDGSVCVKVLDFGISKWTGTASDGHSLTTTASPVGSPRYMSPEQLTLASAVDPRADLWALGVLLFELVTAQHPFAADSVAILCTRILRDPAPPMRSLRPDVPAELEALCLHCLAKDPAQRMPSVADLAVALAPFGSSAARRSVERITARFPGASTTFGDALRARPAAPPRPSRASRAARGLLIATLALTAAGVAAARIANRGSASADRETTLHRAPSDRTPKERRDDRASLAAETPDRLVMTDADAGSVAPSMHISARRASATPPAPPAPPTSVETPPPHPEVDRAAPASPSPPAAPEDLFTTRL
jgi:serine/threonine-protein kinase